MTFRIPSTFTWIERATDALARRNPAYYICLSSVVRIPPYGPSALEVCLCNCERDGVYHGMIQTSWTEWYVDNIMFRGQCVISASMYISGRSLQSSCFFASNLQEIDSASSLLYLVLPIPCRQEWQSCYHAARP